jgi:hypothetical protein
VKTPRLIILFLAVAAAAGLSMAAEAPATAKSPPASQPPLSPRFKQVRQKIDVLFKNRGETPPAPDPRQNPFRPAGAVAVADAGRAAGASGEVNLPAVPEPPSSDLTKLQGSVATLKIGGRLQTGGQLYLMINGKPYKENEVITTQVQGEPVYLRIRQISSREVTLGLNEAEMTLKF